MMGSVKRKAQVAKQHNERYNKIPRSAAIENWCRTNKGKFRADHLGNRMHITYTAKPEPDKSKRAMKPSNSAS